MIRGTHARVLGIALLLATGLARGDEPQARALVTSEAARLFDAEDFEGLEALDARYWKSQERTGSGTWKLTLLYYGVEGAMKERASADEPNNAGLIGRVDRWVADRPNSAMAHIAHAMAYKAVAWRSRRGGAASTAPDGAQDLFGKYMQLAREDLEQHEKLGSTRPQWFDEMIEVAKVQQWPKKQQDALAERAIALEPAYLQTYFSLLEGMMPKWQGGAGDVDGIERLANKGVEGTRKTEGDSLYARIYWNASNADPHFVSYGLYDNTKVSWPRMRQGFRDLLERYPDPWNRNAYAYFACFASDKDATREAFGILGDAAPTALWSDETIFEACRAFPSSKDKNPIERR